MRMFFVFVMFAVAASGQFFWGETVPDVALHRYKPKSALSPLESSDAVLPHLAMGKEWSTTLTVINLSSKPSKTIIDFYSPAGSRMMVEFVNDQGQTATGNQITVVLPARGTMTMVSADSQDLRVGWAKYDFVSSFTDPNFGGKAAIQAIFRAKVLGRPDYEASVLPDWGLDRNLVVPFDNTGGFDTSLALANSSSYSTQTLVVRIYDANGTVLSTRLEELRPLTQIAFETRNRWSETSNRKGSITIEATEYGLACIALQFNPTGAFSTSLFYEFEK